MFLPGYTARVNGKPVETRASPDNLVMFPVPAGDSVVELSYRGQPLLRGTYFFSLGCWALLLLGGAGWAWRKMSRPQAA